MKVEELYIIGERINASIPRVDAMLEAGDFPAIVDLALEQARDGAREIDLNVGIRSVEVMVEMIRTVQAKVNLPLSIDSDDPEKLRQGLRIAGESGTGRITPLLNSVTQARAGELLPLRREHPCRVVLLLSERTENGRIRSNGTAEQALETAVELARQAREHGFAPEEIWFDPGLPPIAGDLEGLLSVVLEVLEGINTPEFEGTHRLVGISNLTHHLPSPIRLPLQNAFLTLAVESGLDTIIGNPAREYRTLPDDDPTLDAVRRILEAEGAERLTILQELYQ
ncbi:dihydropteroate synthase [Gemmatimonadota bacterium]